MKIHAPTLARMAEPPGAQHAGIPNLLCLPRSPEDLTRGGGGETLEARAPVVLCAGSPWDAVPAPFAPRPPCHPARRAEHGRSGTLHRSVGGPPESTGRVTTTRDTAITTPYRSLS